MKEEYYRENGGIIFPNPNAPTGLYMPLSEVEDIVSHNQDSVVIVDEAYIDFGGASALKLTRKYENLLVVQTFSKSRSMAGMRIGYAIGNPALIRALNDVKYSYNSYTMNMPSQILGAKAVEEMGVFQDTVEKIIRTREQAKLRLQELGFTFLNPWRTLSLLPMRPPGRRTSMRHSGRTASLCGTLISRGLTTICALPSEPTRRWILCTAF